MKKEPDYNLIKKICPDIEDSIIIDHLEKIEPDYFDYFSINDIPAHLDAISNLSEENPVEVIFTSDDDLNISCTVVAYDYHAVLSLITGILGTMGLKILSGRVFTYKKDKYIKKTAIKGRGRGRSKLKKLIKKRVIIDHFEGTLSSSIYSHVWVTEAKNKFNDVFSLLGVDKESALKAREKVNELVARNLMDLKESRLVVYPTKIEIENINNKFTLMKVISEDTPFFLYALTTALSLQNIQIEHVHLKTIKNQIVDEFIITDSEGNKIDDDDVIDRIKFSVLLTKQFTYFLGTAPDPYAALSRFEYLTVEILSLPEKGDWVDMFSNPHLMKDLAKLLGASDFIWEDFIRLQYETILPLLKPGDKNSKILNLDEDFDLRLEKVLNSVTGKDEKIRVLNEFKDREIFMIDLDHILNPDTDFKKLSERLSSLANAIISAAVELSYFYLVENYGTPRTVAGLEVKYSVLGLGKFGGTALGYASDIELLFVYSDSGWSDGDNSIKNSEFFDLLVKDLILFIIAKKEGIFDLDMRLRPYGSDGPMAVSLDAFCRYYGFGGDAHSYERLALVRMRPVFGDRDFGQQLKRLRNEFIYSTKSINIDEIHELREKQFLEIKGKGGLNAKFSPGALVDLEYTVQIFQIKYGNEYPELRRSSIHVALNALAAHGILDREEAVQLSEAYDFLRKLINGLRMLRGSAKDLFMPNIDSIEYGHLARRTGYEKKVNLSAAKQLHIEFETRTAIIRTFIEKYFGRESLPGENIGNVADIIFSSGISSDLSHEILSGYGFKNPERALLNLKSLAGEGERLELFAGLAILATDILLHKFDPDMSLNNWERFTSILPDPIDHFKKMMSQPMELDILLSLFSVSQFLSNTLITHPDFLDWVILPENLHKSLNRLFIENELRTLYENSSSHDDWLNKIRRLKKREILRIGTRDICLGMPLDEIVKDLSTLAEAYIQVITEKFLLSCREEYSPETIKGVSHSFSILAFGKLGGNELNYSSDIDLLMIFDKDKESEIDEKLYSRIIEAVSADLSSHIEEGHAYRVDLRLRPYGSSGSLANSIDQLIEYYRENSSLWEIQALLKVRPVAGNLIVGYKFIDMLKELYSEKIPHEKIINSISKLRSMAVKEKSRGLSTGIDVKNGIGGIRDIEFLVQGLQLIYLPFYPDLQEANTLRALKILKELGIISEDIRHDLSRSYVFMRKVEHYLQLYEDRQVHSLPSNPEHLHALAKIMLGIDVSADSFLKKVDEYRKRIREAYDKYLIDFESNNCLPD